METDAEGNLRPGQPMPEIERWCPACRTVYPNEPAQG
jgi:hypothetical protein